MINRGLSRAQFSRILFGAPALLACSSLAAPLAAMAQGDQTSSELPPRGYRKDRI